MQRQLYTAVATATNQYCGCRDVVYTKLLRVAITRSVVQGIKPKAEEVGEHHISVQ